MNNFKFVNKAKLDFFFLSSFIYFLDEVLSAIITNFDENFLSS